MEKEKGKVVSVEWGRYRWWLPIYKLELSVAATFVLNILGIIPVFTS